MNLITTLDNLCKKIFPYQELPHLYLTRVWVNFTITARAWAGLASGYSGRFARYGFSHSWLDSAIRISEYAIQLDANSASTYAVLGLAYSVKGLIDQATSAYLRALECNPNHFSATANLGVNYKEQGEYDLALRWYKKAETLDPTGYVNKVNIGVLYSYFGYFAVRLVL